MHEAGGSGLGALMPRVIYWPRLAGPRRGGTIAGRWVSGQTTMNGKFGAPAVGRVEHDGWATVGRFSGDQLADVDEPHVDLHAQRVDEIARMIGPLMPSADVAKLMSTSAKSAAVSAWRYSLVDLVHAA
jgi:hypothetical protein